MKQWRKLYRVTWDQYMSQGKQIAAVKAAFPDEEDNAIWMNNTERRSLYLRDEDGDEQLAVRHINYHSTRTVIDDIIAAFKEHMMDCPLFYKIENEDGREERLRDANDWWPGVDTEAGEHVVLDSCSLHMTAIRYADDDVDPVADGMFAATDEQIGGLFRALRHASVKMEKDVTFDTGCEMISVDEERRACPVEW